MSADTSSEQTYSADRPIRSRNEDRLGRAAFADAIADAIGKWSGRDSLVVAICGRWGSGKSSLKNLILESLENRNEYASPTIVDFNPWQYSVRENLTQTFFKSLAAALGKTSLQKDDQRKQKLLTYSHALELGASFSDLLRSRILTGIYVLVAFLVGSSLGLQRTWPFVPWLIIAGLVALGELLRRSASTMQALSSYLESRSIVDKTTLPRLKKETAELLSDRSRPVLVVMDDLDRLTADEIKEVFRLVKVHADFPKVVFMLLYQRDVVEQAVNDDPEKGRAYLGKIVQVGFDIPAIEQQRLEAVLFGELDRIVGGEPLGKRFSPRRWRTLYVNGLRPFFTSLRDVYRLLSTLRFHVGLFTDGSSFGANPVDLIGIEVIRMFEPGCYQAIAQRKSALVGGENPLEERSKGSERARLAADEIVSGVQEDRREAVRAILRALFPRIPSTVEGIPLGVEELTEDEAFRDLRICSRVVFDRYFQFAVSQGDLPQDRIDRLLDLTGDRDALAKELRLLAEGQLLKRAIECLGSYKNDLPMYNAESFVTAFFDVGDEIPKGDDDMFSPSPMRQAFWLISEYLLRLRDSRRQGEVLKRAIYATDGVALPTMVVAWGGSAESGGSGLIASEDVSELQGLCVSKIKRLAQEDTLLETREVRLLLDAWKEWGKPEDVRAFAERSARDGPSAIKLVRALLNSSRRTSYGKGEVRVVKFIKLAEIEEYVPWEAMSKTFETLDMRLSLEDREAYDAFQNAARRRREGKPDFDARSLLLEEPL